MLKFAGIAILGALAFAAVPTSGSNAAPIAPQSAAAEAGNAATLTVQYGYRNRYRRNRYRNRGCVVKRTCVSRYGRTVCRVVRRCRY